MIKFRCSCCNQKIGVPDEYADKNVRCPKCHDAILVPSATVDEISIDITHDDNSTENRTPKISPIANEPVLSIEDEEEDTSPETSIIHFKCSSCGKDMEAPEALRGKTLLCDGCGIEVEVSESNSHESQEEIETLYKIKSLTKTCPYCGEEILEVAKKCKHCGEFLDNNDISAIHQAKPATDFSQNKHTDIFAILCLATGMLAFVLPLYVGIAFIATCYVTSIISWYRLRENSDLKGKGIRIVGAIFGLISMLGFLYQAGMLDEVVAHFEQITQQTDENSESDEKKAAIKSFLMTLSPFADEMRGMENAWEIGISYGDYGKAILRLKNAYDKKGIAPDDASIWLLMRKADVSIGYHTLAHQHWGMAIKTEYIFRASSERKRDEYRDEALKHGSEFLKSYEYESKVH